jgi:transcriptional regulator with AAA-type ATPase domain
MREKQRSTDPSRALERRFRLLISKGPAVRRQVLTGRRWVVGRGEGCDVRLLDPTIAPRQVVLEADGAALGFRDLGGKRTLLDGRPRRTGRLAPGSTLLVGTTRLTVEQLGRRARVRVVRDLRKTAPMHRPLAPLQPAQSAPEADVLAALQPLLQPPSPHETLSDVATGALESAMDILERDVGLLARIDGERVLVLATSSRLPASSELRIPRQLLRRARKTPEPWLVGKPGKRGTQRDQLVIPLGEDTSGVLLLAESRPGAPASPELAKLIGAIVSYRIAHADERLALRESLAGWQRRRAPASPLMMSSRRLLAARNKLRRAAGGSLPVFLSGEAGTEKEELARYVHARSDRAGGPFVALHCGSLPAGRQGTELAAALRRAAEGSLFIEDPEELDHRTQRQLARLLKSAPCRRIGASIRSVDEAVASGALHRDLAACFCSLRLVVPPLRSAPADIVPLAERMLADLCSDPGQAPITLTETAKRCLIAYHWPGNLDELRAAIEYAASRCRDCTIAPRHLPEEVRIPSRRHEPALATLAAVERRHILRVLEIFGGSKRHAAQALGIAPSTLYDKLRRIEREAD